MAKKSKIKQKITRGVAHVHATFNNTIITITDVHGNALAFSSGGAVGFKGTRKSTPFAAQVAAEKVAQSAMEYGLQEIDVVLKGPGAGREAAVRSLRSAGLDISCIKDVTPLPHNGCRPKKMRRV